MGKKNPFVYKTRSVNFVLLIANLDGQIVHVMGDSNVIGATYRQLFLKNFFTDVIAPQSCLKLYQSVGSQEIMPPSVHQRKFKCKLQNHESKNYKGNSVIYQASCFRIFVRFQKFDSFHNRTKISRIQSQSQRSQLMKDQTIKQVILIQLKPSSVLKLKEEVDQYSEISSEIVKQEQAMMIVSPEKVQLNNNCFGTPQKSKRAIERSTEKIYEELSNQQKE